MQTAQNASLTYAISAQQQTHHPQNQPRESSLNYVVTTTFFFQNRITKLCPILQVHSHQCHVELKQWQLILLLIFIHASGLRMVFPFHFHGMRSCRRETRRTIGTTLNTVTLLESYTWRLFAYVHYMRNKEFQGDMSCDNKVLINQSINQSMDEANVETCRPPGSFGLSYRCWVTGRARYLWPEIHP